VAIHLDYNESGNKIRVGTHGRGVYETSIVTGVIDYSNIVPAGHRLYQNYPNPFNPTTSIRYAVPFRDHVSLVVYDGLGKVVARLVDESQAPGTYTAAWDAQGAASGVYYCRLTAGGFAETKKLLLVR
jgi:hypothetical protein